MRASVERLHCRSRRWYPQRDSYPRLHGFDSRTCYGGNTRRHGAASLNNANLALGACSQGIRRLGRPPLRAHGGLVLTVTQVACNHQLGVQLSGSPRTGV